MCKEKDVEGIIAEIEKLDTEIAQLEALKDAFKDELKEFLVAREREEYAVEGTGYTLHYKEVTSMKFNTKKFKEEHEKMYNRYVSPSVSRPFKITKKKKIA